MADREFYTTVFTPNAAVPNGSTMTVPYPSGTTQVNFGNAPASAVMMTGKNNRYAQVDSKISVVYGADAITVTNSTGRSLMAGIPIRFEFPTGSVTALAGSSGITEIQKISRYAYDALATKNPKVMYVVGDGYVTASTQRGGAGPIRIRLLGDSIVSQNDTVSPVTTNVTSAYLAAYGRFWTWLRWLTGNQIGHFAMFNAKLNKRVGMNNGMSGDMIAGVVSRLPGILSTMTEPYMFIHIGTNSINAGIDLETLKSQYLSMLGLITAAGVIPIVTTVLPRNSVDGSSNWSNTNGGTTTATKQKVQVAFNNWLVNYCRDKGIRCVDWAPIFTAADGTANTGWTADGLHPNELGSYYLAQEVVRQLADILPYGVNTAPVGAFAAYDATYNPYGNLLNGTLTGTGGATSNAGGIGTITSTVPDNWRLTKTTSTTTSVAASIVSRTDGRAGNVIQLDFTGTGGGSSAEDWRFEYWNGSSASLTNGAVLDTLISMGAEIEIVNNSSGLIKSVGTRLSESSNVTRTASTISFDAATKTINDSGNGFSSIVPGFWVSVSGASNSANNSAFLVTGVTAGTLTLDPSSVLVTEAAGSSVTVCLPSAVANNTASNSVFPKLSGTSPVLHMQTPLLMPTHDGNLVPRFQIYIDGTVSGTASIRIARPYCCQSSVVPTLMNYVADNV